MKKSLCKFIPLWMILCCSPFILSYSQSGVIHIRFGSTGDPLKGLTIAWNSQGTGDSISWGYTSGLENGKFPGAMSPSITGTRFEYTFPELSAGTTIYYQLFDSHTDGWTGIRTYKTAADPADKFSFTVLGDCQSNVSQWRKISQATLESDFALFMGDIVNDGASASDWRNWFDYGDTLISRDLAYPAVGNHDDDNSTGGYDNFLSLFTLPGNELYYSFQYGNALFICLNSQDPYNSEQYDWLLSTLEANRDQTWKFVYFHKPFYASPAHIGDMDPFFNTWWKAFDDYGVDIIFNGHIHNYARTKPINRNISTVAPVDNYGSGDNQGRCQIVTVAAPLRDAADPDLWWLDNSTSRQNFCHVEIAGDRLILKAMDDNRFLIDSLLLDKQNAEIIFRVDLSEITDLHEGGKVWLIFGDRDSSFTMSDKDGDHIYSRKMTLPIGADLKFFFSYQNGPDQESDRIDEIVPDECAGTEGFRELKVPSGNLSLPAFFFGRCIEAPWKITFQTDLGGVPDLYDGGAVRLMISGRDTSYVMNDPDGDSIYSVTLHKQAGADLRYIFAYQNGPDSVKHLAREYVPEGCSDQEGYRTVRVPDSNLVLPALEFGSCYEPTDEPFIPEISIPIISGFDDGEEYLAELEPAGPLGGVDLTSSDLEICFDHEPQVVGLLFREVYIPRGAAIKNAYVQFTCDVPQIAEVPGISIYGAAEGTVDEISTEPFNISSHPPTGVKVDWSPPPQLNAYDATETERTADIGAVIEEIVALKDWEPRNNMLILIAGSPGQTKDVNREVWSYDGNPSGAPVLHVQFNALHSPRITFQVDVNEVPDLYPGGAVWLSRDLRDTSYVMTDGDGDGIYAATLDLKAGSLVKYFFSYQNGEDPESDNVEEIVPDACDNEGGYRELKVPHRDLALNAVSFGSCIETRFMVTHVAVTNPEIAVPVEAGNAIQMNAVITPAYASDASVTWNVDNGTIAAIDAETGMLTILRSGTVEVTATANDGSGVEGTREVQMIITSSGSDREVAGQEISIYPNPTSGIVHISNPSSAKFTCRIHTVGGMIVASLEKKDPVTEINMTGFSKGVYLVEIVSPGMSVTRKLIVQ